MNDQQAWDHLNHSVFLSSVPVGHCFMESQSFALEDKLGLMHPASIGLLQPLLFSYLPVPGSSAAFSLQRRGHSCCSLPDTTLCFGARRVAPTCLPLMELLFEVGESWVSSVLVRTLQLGFAQIFGRLMCPGQMRPSFLRLPFFGLPPLRMVHG